jgi:hypothetical protein
LELPLWLRQFLILVSTYSHHLSETNTYYIHQIVLSELPYFLAHEATLDTTKDVTYAAIGAAVTVGKDITAGQTTM